jgi:autophagy-related protein 16
LDYEGTMIASGHLDNRVRIWDGRSGQIIHEISDIHSGQITGITSTSGTNNHFNE